MTPPTGTLSLPGQPRMTGTTATGRTCHPHVTPPDRSTPERTGTDRTTTSPQTRSHQHEHHWGGTGPTILEARYGLPNYGERFSAYKTENRSAGPSPDHHPSSPRSARQFLP